MSRQQKLRICHEQILSIFIRSTAITSLMSLFTGSCLILLSSLATAVYFILLTRWMRSWPGLSSNFFLCITNYAAAFLLLPVWALSYKTGHVRLPGPEGWRYFAIAALLLILSRELYFYAYSHVDVACITVFSALTPLYALLTSYLFLHEMPSLRVICGIMLVAGALYSVFLPLGDIRTGLGSALQPFRRILHSWPISCGFLSTVPTAFAAVFQKEALVTMDIASFSLCLFLLTGTVALGLESCKGRAFLTLTSRNWRMIRHPIFWWIAFLLILMHLCFGPILMHYHSAVALTLQRSSILFQIILAYYFLDQKKDIKKRLTAGMVIILGLGILWYPGS